MRKAFVLAVALLAVRMICSGESPHLKDANLEPEFAPVILQSSLLLDQGGAAVLETDKGRYFIAIGVTEIRNPSAQEKLRQIRVGRVQAQKEATAFLERTTVVAEEKLVEKTTITTQENKKTIAVLKTLDQSTVTTVQGMLGTLPQVGTWESANGKLFFYAIGKKLN